MKQLDTIYFAPFDGITTYVFREVYTRNFQGVDKLFTGFFTDVYKQKSLSHKAKDIEQTRQNNIQLVPQILSKDAAEIIRFGKLCFEKGFEEINWNLGCPFSRVAAKQRGSGLLPHPDIIENILKTVIPELPIKLSIKCRLGYRSPDEILQLFPIFNRFPLSEIIVHARIGKQLYKGGVDCETFNKIISVTKLQLCYNGDIFKKEDYLRFKTRFRNVKIWMIGRGLLSNPFLPEKIKEMINNDDETQRIRSFIDDLYYSYRKEFNDNLHVLNILKELWSYLSLSFDSPRKTFNLLKKTKSFEDYEKGINKIFDEYHWVGNRGNKFGET